MPAMPGSADYLERLDCPPPFQKAGGWLTTTSDRSAARLRGFRTWLSPLDPDQLEVCDCASASKLGRHFDGGRLERVAASPPTRPRVSSGREPRYRTPLPTCMSFRLRPSVPIRPGSRDTTCHILRTCVRPGQPGAWVSRRHSGVAGTGCTSERALEPSSRPSRM
jgi:hypothetical protein